jgi:membrane-associated protein
MTLEPDLAALAGPTVYAVVFTMVFVESGLLVGFFLPGDTLLFAAGLVSADPRSGVSMPLLAGGVVVAAVTGDAVGYTIGARAGRPYIERRVAKGRLNARHLERAERFYARYGWWSVVVARWIPWVRTFVPVLAGASRMPYARFASANLLGALVWGAGLVMLGHRAASDEDVRNVAYVVGGVFAVGFTVVVILRAFVHRRRLRTGEREPTG